MSKSSATTSDSGDFYEGPVDIDYDSESTQQSGIAQAQTIPQTIRIRPSDIPWLCRAMQITILWHLVLPGEPLALDAEFQVYKKRGWAKFKHRLGRVTVVNTLGQVVVDVYVCYPWEKGTLKGCPPKRFGVEVPDLLHQNGAVAGHKIEGQLKKLMSNRPIVVHDKRGDTNSFYFDEFKDAFSPSNGVTLYDTQAMYADLQPQDGTPSLSTAYSIMTGKEIQAGGIHSPVEDSQATMELFKLKYFYDRAAEAAKFEAQKALARDAGKPNLMDFAKVKQSQKQMKRNRASAAILASETTIQATIRSDPTVTSSTVKGFGYASPVQTKSYGKESYGKKGSGVPAPGKSAVFHLGVGDFPALGT